MTFTLAMNYWIGRIPEAQATKLTVDKLEHIKSKSMHQRIMSAD